MSVGRVETLKICMNSPKFEKIDTKNYWMTPDLAAMSSLIGIISPIETGWFVRTAYDLKGERMLRTSVSIFYGRGIMSIAPFSHRSAVFG